MVIAAAGSQQFGVNCCTARPFCCRKAMIPIRVGAHLPWLLWRCLIVALVWIWFEAERLAGRLPLLRLFTEFDEDGWAAAALSIWSSSELDYYCCCCYCTFPLSLLFTKSIIFAT